MKAAIEVLKAKMADAETSVQQAESDRRQYETCAADSKAKADHWRSVVREYMAAIQALSARPL